MEPAEKQWEAEHLEAVKDLIRRQIALLEREFDDSKNHIIDINADLWENAHHLIYDFDDVVELQQRSMELTLHTGLAKRSRNRIAMLHRMLQSPFFGRIDFIGPNQTKPARIYIGMNSLTAPQEVRPRVYDWRAPICSMFYDFGVGDACYAGPSGEISGAITGKRQYKIHDGQFEYLFDSDLTIDDDILQRELSLHSESKLRTIVSSIQREQNRAVRHDPGRDLLVFGPAGSGKTSIGLHRLAWQLYRLRGQLASENILIFSQNDIFSTYISGIIPELGEEDVARVSFFQLIHRQFGGGKTVLDACEQAEYLVSAGEGDARLKGIRLKYSAGFLRFLEEAIESRTAAFADVLVFDQVVCAGETLSLRYAEERDRLPFVRVARLGDFAADRIEDHFARNAAEIKALLLDEMVDAKELDAVFRLRMEEEKGRARRDIAAQADLGAEGLYRQLLPRYLDSRGLGRDILADTLAQLDAGRLRFEDGLALLCIALLTGERKADRSIRHVLVDEAQDFCPLQHAILKRMTPASRYTVLADVEQAMFPAVNIREQAALQEIYGGETMELTKSYRSTRQINALAAKLLAGSRPEYFDRSGPMPEVVHCEDGAAVLQVLRRCGEYGSVGILTKTVRQAEALHKRLGRQEIGLLTGSADAFRSGTVVLPVALAKGLEFDAVIIPDCTADVFHTPLDKRMLYLMCTRALHRLFLVCPGELTGFLSPYPECYEVGGED